MQAYEMGETCANKRPYTNVLVKTSRIILYTAVTVTTLTVALNLNSEESVSWWLTFTPMWTGSGLALILLVASIFSPIPYMRRLLRTGEPRVGKHPSITELIPLLLASAGKSVLLICFLVGQILIIDKLEASTEITLQPDLGHAHPTFPRTIAVCLIPFYILVVFYFLVAVIIVNWSREIFGVGIPLLAFFVMLSLRVDDVVPNLSWWAVLSPLMIIIVACAGLLGYYAYYRWDVYDSKHRCVVGLVFAALICCYLFQVFLAIVLQREGPQVILNLETHPVLLVLPLFLAELMLFGPLIIVLFGESDRWGIPRTSDDLWEIPLMLKGSEKLLKGQHYTLVRDSI